MRIALFGGSFDPPHRGHLAIARAAAAQFALDRVLLAPTGLQPLKPGGPAAPFADRLAMVTLLCVEDPHLAPSALDAPLAGDHPNYTVDTLRRLRELHPSADLFNLVGADAFRTLGHWREPQQALALAEWIVVSRPGYPLNHPEEPDDPDDPEDPGDPGDLTLTPIQRTRVHTLGNVHEDISATTLRTRLAAGDPCDGLLPASIAAYIQQHGLYRPR